MTAVHSTNATYPEFYEKECRLWTFVKELAQPASFVGKFVGYLSYINRLQQHAKHSQLIIIVIIITNALDCHFH